MYKQIKSVCMNFSIKDQLQCTSISIYQYQIPELGRYLPARDAPTLSTVILWNITPGAEIWTQLLIQTTVYTNSCVNGLVLGMSIRQWTTANMPIQRLVYMPKTLKWGGQHVKQALGIISGCNAICYLNTWMSICGMHSMDILTLLQTSQQLSCKSNWLRQTVKTIWHVSFLPLLSWLNTNVLMTCHHVTSLYKQSATPVSNNMNFYINVHDWYHFLLSTSCISLICGLVGAVDNVVSIWEMWWDFWVPIVPIILTVPLYSKVLLV